MNLQNITSSNHPAQPLYTAEEHHVLAEARRITRSKMRSADLINAWSLLIDYLTTHMVAERIEVFRVLFLDTGNRLIRDRIMARGIIDHVPVYTREVIRSALILDAKALILCHNHPSGDPAPSSSDKKLTEEIRSACLLMDLTLHDHVIVGHGREKTAFSMRAAGMI